MRGKTKASCQEEEDGQGRGQGEEGQREGNLRQTLPPMFGDWHGFKTDAMARYESTCLHNTCYGTL
jgi:hypothetical protein